MKFAHVFRKASGDSAWDCHFLADRWDGKPWMEDHAESWVGQVVDGRVFTLLGQVGWLTSLWRSPSGAVYVSEGSARRGGVHINRAEDPLRPAWEFHALPCVVAGIWGLDDRFVLAWGPHSRKREEAFFRWDGQQWLELPSPGDVVAVHGLAQDLVYAVGGEGLISRWDGTQWHQAPSFTEAVMTAVHVVSEDEMYACSDAGVMEGSLYGWSEVAESPGMLMSIVKHQKQVWVAGGTYGLFNLHGNQLDEAEPRMKTMSLDARQRLVLATDTALADTEDGKQFRSIPIAEFIARTQDVPKLW
ncbi:hypothetical protein MYSTI_06886 [Myxococcus stipitatus DSM 14675]|uniref:Uncharacterized protein n=1 Tax=Myxococcus stipitatus (strain DSM 14675 / JCM 12634 / Mx s8) TaxID=1278073 RepID=L7UNU4_MYXSD|nr:hypothetical protein [Myxococcus stipitatus]AGC48159.1 hypothetical protein MYSTI_06886 [Myxococcus stipitatus DSM 14675]